MNGKIAETFWLPFADRYTGNKQEFYDESSALGGERSALPEQLVMNGLHAGAMLIWRKSFAAVGPFATNWVVGEFIEWYGRAQALGLHSLVLPEVVMRRRLHATNLTRRTSDQRTNYTKILKAHLDANRLRQPGGASHG